MLPKNDIRQTPSFSIDINNGRCPYFVYMNSLNWAIDSINDCRCYFLDQFFLLFFSFLFFSFLCLFPSINQFLQQASQFLLPLRTVKGGNISISELLYSLSPFLFVTKLQYSQSGFDFGIGKDNNFAAFLTVFLADSILVSIFIGLTWNLTIPFCSTSSGQ